MSEGYNPMRYNCESQGCFNLLQRPKIEQFASVLPGRIAMSDIDATVEVNGRFFFLEMKSFEGPIPTGQRIYFERLTRLSPRIVVVVICGDAATMAVTSMLYIYGGRVSDWQPATLDDVRAALADFTEWARGR